MVPTCGTLSVGVIQRYLLTPFPLLLLLSSTYLLSLGFLQVNNDTKLVAVPGPVPSLLHCCKEACELPVAFTSEATHFKPIVLAQDTGVVR